MKFAAKEVKLMLCYRIAKLKYDCEKPVRCKAG